MADQESTPLSRKARTIELRPLKRRRIWEDAMYTDEAGNPKLDKTKAKLIDKRDDYVQKICRVLDLSRNYSVGIVGADWEGKGRAAFHYGQRVEMINDEDFEPESSDYIFGGSGDLKTSLFTEYNETLHLVGADSREVHHVLTCEAESLLDRFDFVVWVLHDKHQDTETAREFCDWSLPYDDRFITFDVQEAFRDMTMAETAADKQIGLGHAMWRLWNTTKTWPEFVRFHNPCNDSKYSVDLYKFFQRFVMKELYGTTYLKGVMPRRRPRYTYDGPCRALVGNVLPVKASTWSPFTPPKSQFGKRKVEAIESPVLPPAKEGKAQAVAAKQATPKQAGTGHATTEHTAKETPAGEHAAKGQSPVYKTAAEKLQGGTGPMAAEQSPIESAPSKQSPIESAPSKQPPIEPVSSKQSPIEPASSKQSPIEQPPTKQDTTEQGGTVQGGTKDQLDPVIEARIQYLEDLLTWLADPGNVQPADQSAVEARVLQYCPSVAKMRNRKQRKMDQKLDMFKTSIRVRLLSTAQTVIWLMSGKEVGEKNKEVVTDRVEAVFHVYSTKVAAMKPETSNNGDKPGSGEPDDTGKDGSLDGPGADQGLNDISRNKEQPSKDVSCGGEGEENKVEKEQAGEDVSCGKKEEGKKVDELVEGSMDCGVDSG